MVGGKDGKRFAKRQKQDNVMPTRSPTPEAVIHQRETEWLERQYQREEKLRKRQQEAETVEVWSNDGQLFDVFIEAFKCKNTQTQAKKTSTRRAISSCRTYQLILSFSHIFLTNHYFQSPTITKACVNSIHFSHGRKRLIGTIFTCNRESLGAYRGGGTSFKQ